jgi:hypothetical protein
MSEFINRCLNDQCDEIFWRKTTSLQRLLSLLFLRPLGHNPFTYSHTHSHTHTSTSNENNSSDNLLQHYNFINFSFLIMGMALVFNGFDAPLHKHREEETYVFVWGTGHLHLDGEGEWCMR